MAALNLTLDIPCEPTSIDVSALKKELIAFAKILISSPSVVRSKEMVDEVDPFAELDTTWGGDRDANNIAEELHSMRENTRTIEAW